MAERINAELLAALEALVAVMNDPRAEAIKQRLKAKQQARAAIAKARGES